MTTNKPQRGRNDPCPCGSGRKYKQCCLAKDEAAEREARAKAAVEAQAAAEQPEPAAEDAHDHKGHPHAHPRGENKPWKKAATGGAHPTQRRTTHRKVGSG